MENNADKQIGWYSETQARISGANIYRSARSGYPVLVTCFQEEKPDFDDVKRVGYVAEFLKRSNKGCESDTKEIVCPDVAAQGVGYQYGEPLGFGWQLVADAATVRGLVEQMENQEPPVEYNPENDPVADYVN